MKVQGKDLIFISRIQRTGLGVRLIKEQNEVSFLAEETFELTSLSITEGTYIAKAFNSYAVKIKEK